MGFPLRFFKVSFLEFTPRTNMEPEEKYPDQKGERPRKHKYLGSMLAFGDVPCQLAGLFQLICTDTSIGWQRCTATKNTHLSTLPPWLKLLTRDLPGSKVFSTHLWNTPLNLLPTGYEGIPFIVGLGNCLGCALRVWCNFLGLVHWKSWLKNRWKKTLHLRIYVRLGDGPSPLEQKCWGSLVFCFIHSNAHPGGHFFRKVLDEWKVGKDFFLKKASQIFLSHFFSCRDVRFE